MKQQRLKIVAVALVAAVLGFAGKTVINLTSQVYGILPSANGGIGVDGTAVTALGNTGALTMDFSKGMVFTTTPSGAITLSASNCATGRHATVIVTSSGTTSFTITPSTNFKGTALSTGTTTGKTFGWSFVCNGITAVQMGAATAAM